MPSSLPETDDEVAHSPRKGATRVQEMLLVGRGGEGVVLASQLLADAFSRAGLWAQSFPEFKAERRGAPISAFLRWDETSPIRRRYRVRECDVLVVVSPSPPLPDVLRSVRPGGLVILNREERFPLSGPFEIAHVPGSRIARDDGVLSSEGRPMGNVAVLGACMKLLLPEGMHYLEQAIEARLGAAAAINVLAAREGYERCRRQRRREADARLEPVAAAAGTAPAATLPLFPVSHADSLANHTGSWSLDRPILHDECSACALCALFCPEGAITRENGHMAIDYLYCKGCGICEVVCPVRNALTMEEVPA
jgi:2-oxoacid:acceptor oxidoreductase gamma subunit (pyruvate/2-ketoisovalerate family)/2-oxoacid:acceptor oxidoreductase delta subunit (pyruvate/2-ketoisovalerate family)